MRRSGSAISHQARLGTSGSIFGSRGFRVSALQNLLLRLTQRAHQENFALI